MRLVRSALVAIALAAFAGMSAPVDALAQPCKPFNASPIHERWVKIANVVVERRTACLSARRTVHGYFGGRSLGVAGMTGAWRVKRGNRGRHSITFDLDGARGVAAAMKRCRGSMLADERSLRVTVYKSGSLKCARAKKIVREFRVLKRGIRGKDEPYRLRRYPAWSCSEGAGGGGCRNGKRVAGWILSPP